MNKNEHVGTAVDVERDMNNMPIADGQGPAGKSLMAQFLADQAKTRASLNPAETSFDIMSDSIPESDLLKSMKYGNGTSQPVMSAPTTESVNYQPYEQIAVSQPSEKSTEQPSVNQINKTGASLKDQIAALEDNLSNINSTFTSNKAFAADTYLDEFGDETYYVRNVSGGHIQLEIGDTSYKLEKGKCEDLLKYFQLEDIKKSKDIRICINGHKGQGPMIKRLTPAEYLSFLEQEYASQKRINEIRRAQQLAADNANPANSQRVIQAPIRPLIYDKLNKLALSKSDTPHKGITTVEFASWINAENFTKQELDFMIGSIEDQELRILINERKKGLIER